MKERAHWCEVRENRNHQRVGDRHLPQVTADHFGILKDSHRDDCQLLLHMLYELSHDAGHLLHDPMRTR